jgi:hypothetical protein
LVADLSDSTTLPQDPIALREVAEVADVEAAVGSMTVVAVAAEEVAVVVLAIGEDVVVLEVAEVEAQTAAALVTLRARSRLFKSLASLEDQMSVNTAAHSFL